jgi:Bacterial transcriptional activator domain
VKSPGPWPWVWLSRGHAGHWAGQRPWSSRWPGTGWRSHPTTWTRCASNGSSPRGPWPRRWLWRGPALADAGGYADPFAGRLEELRLDATVTLLRRELDAGQAARVGELEALAAEHPLHEKLTGLMTRLAAEVAEVAAVARPVPCA